MEDKVALQLFGLAGKLASTIPDGNPIRILKYQAKRLINLPDQAGMFSQSDLIMLVATVYPLVFCLRKIFSYNQIRSFIDAMEKGEIENAQRIHSEQGTSEDNGKPN